MITINLPSLDVNLKLDPGNEAYLSPNVVQCSPLKPKIRVKLAPHDQKLAVKMRVHLDNGKVDLPVLIPKVPLRRINFLVTLYEFQEKFIKWAENKDKVIVNADMGLGKTAMFIRRVCDRQYRHVLVVMPLGLLRQWEQEFRKFTDVQPGEIVVYQGHGRLSMNLESCRVILTNYDSVRIDMEDPSSPLFRIHTRLQMVALDEGHIIRNKKTLIHKACCKMSLGCPEKWVLTGTLIHNKFADFVGVCDFLEIYGSQFYSTVHIEAFKSHHYYRLTKAEVKMTPPMAYNHYLEFDEDHAVEYNEALAEVKLVYKKYLQ